MKKEIICILLPALFLFFVAYEAHVLSRQSAVMASTHVAGEQIDEWLSRIERSEEPISKAWVMRFLRGLKEADGAEHEAWQEYANGLASLRIAAVLFGALLSSFFLERVIRARRSSSGE